MAPRTDKLVAMIAENVSKIEDFLTSKQASRLSMFEDVPIHLQADKEFAGPRDAAILACRDLLAMLSGSFGVITSQTATEFANTQAICRFKIAESFPEGKGSATYSELAGRCDLSESDVRRIVRAAIPTYVFREESNGVVAQTAASKMLATNSLMRQWVEMTASEVHPAALRMADAMGKWPGSEEPNNTGYNIANNTEDVAFAHMAKDPARSVRFLIAMTLFSRGPGFSPDHLLENYPWQDIKNGTVVDVGGSNGRYSIPIARRYSGIKVVVQDHSEVVEKGVADLASDLEGRISFMEHDFFSEQPVKGAAVYLLRWILHDWSDTYAIRILRALVPALAKESKIVLHEYILPEPGRAPTIQDRTLRIFDTSMRALTNGKEREARDWHALVASADPRLRIERMETPAMSSLGIIVIGLE